MTKQKKPQRREEILQALAMMLEQEPGARITTARLAQAVGVSEAALYRHFPSKARMFEGLMDFVEETIFSRFNQIRAEENLGHKDKVEQMLLVVLTFAERNPGMCRLLTGDVLAGEHPRLHEQMNQMFGRIQVQIKQVMQEAQLAKHHAELPPTPAANLLLAVVEGRIQQFVRSRFQRDNAPSKMWNEQWQKLSLLI
ncbi:nucleoid occlusion factor SlmA [Salinibius halmophilus]|uniref:nucleoid occlusion factor SlmA n=1 Tax=Salinibius halmophilus TaxID=1853216 RepID=UPI000E66EF21|nr:nucleoid occlusion factor SlmA [Salinibius halmophilus]